MPYEKHTWETGEVITSEKLNHMEEGIENATGVFPISAETVDTVSTLSKTWKEIHDAINAGKYAYVIEPESDTTINIDPVIGVSFEDEVYLVICSINYTTDTATGYPSHE